MASGADGFLGLLVAGLSIEECRDSYREKLRPFIKSFIDYKDKESRLALLEKYFNFHGEPSTQFPDLFLIIVSIIFSPQSPSW